MRSSVTLPVHPSRRNWSKLLLGRASGERSDGKIGEAALEQRPGDRREPSTSWESERHMPHGEPREADQQVEGCRTCGVIAVPHGRREYLLHDAAKSR